MKKGIVFFLLLTAVSMVMSGCMLPIFGNEPPVIESSPKVTAIAGVLYTYQIDVNDDSSERLVYSLILAPEGMTIDGSLGLVMWTPAESQVGEHDVSIRVSDGWYKTLQDFSIEVSLVQLSSISVEPLKMDFSILNSTSPITSITATYSDGSSAVINKADCSYVSSDSSNATVDEEGNITSVSNGNAIITVSYTEDGTTKTDTISVTVAYSPPPSGGGG
jgi:hypothetical protein